MSDLETAVFEAVMFAMFAAYAVDDWFSWRRRDRGKGGGMIAAKLVFTTCSAAFFLGAAIFYAARACR